MDFNSGDNIGRFTIVKEVEKLLDYESVFREAMAKSQQETYALMNSSLGFEICGAIISSKI